MVFSQVYFGSKVLIDCCLGICSYQRSYKSLCPAIKCNCSLYLLIELLSAWLSAYPLSNVSNSKCIIQTYASVMISSFVFRFFCLRSCSRTCENTRSLYLPLLGSPVPFCSLLMVKQISSNIFNCIFFHAAHESQSKNIENNSSFVAVALLGK